MLSSVYLGPTHACPYIPHLAANQWNLHLWRYTVLNVSLWLYLIFLLFSERCTGGIALRLLVSPCRRWYRPAVVGIAFIARDPCRTPLGLRPWGAQRGSWAINVILPSKGCSITFIARDPCRTPLGRAAGVLGDKCDTTLQGV